MQDINKFGMEELTNEESFDTFGGSGDIAYAIGWLFGAAAGVVKNIVEYSMTVEPIPRNEVY